MTSPCGLSSTEASRDPDSLHGALMLPRSMSQERKIQKKAMSPFTINLGSHIELLVPGHRPAQIQEEGSQTQLLREECLHRSVRSHVGWKVHVGVAVFGK